MTVAPGSHRTPGIDHTDGDRQMHLFGRGITLDAAAMAQAVPIELQPGKGSFHDAFTVHGSPANTSPMRRCGYTMRYMPAHVVHPPRPDALRQHRIYLVRGQDRTGGRNVYAPVP